MSDVIFETFDSLFKTLHRQGRRIEELEHRVNELERRLEEHKRIEIPDITTDSMLASLGDCSSPAVGKGVEDE